MDEKVSTFPTVNGRQYGDDDAESFGSVIEWMITLMMINQELKVCFLDYAYVSERKYAKYYLRHKE